MLSNETVKGAENLALMYSFYQSCKLHGVNFEEYMKKVLAVMTMNMDKIIFEKKIKMGPSQDLSPIQFLINF